MSWLPSSPRQRRRVFRLAAVAALAGLVALVVAIVPNYSGHTRQRFSSGAPQLVKADRQVPVAPRDRRAIDALLDRFVPAAVGRRDPAAAYSLATAALRSSAKRDAWARGDLPVLPLAVRDSRFHAWSVDYSLRNEINLELLVHAKPGDELAAVAYTVDVKRVRGRWLVDSFTPRGLYPAVAKGARPTSTETAAVKPVSSIRGEGHSGLWLVVPLGLLTVPLVLLSGFAVLRWRRQRAAERAYRGAGA